MSGGKLRAAIALQGRLPLQLPGVGDERLRKMAVLNDARLRFVGLAFMLSGLFNLLASHSHA